MEVTNTTGRRKTAIARLYISEGKGNITVNNRDIKAYFTTSELQYLVKQPLNIIGVPEKYDVKATIRGGGVKGQAEAMRLAMARALVKLNPDNRKPLKEQKLLTRDSRKVERKKPGRPGARKRFQFSKR